MSLTVSLPNGYRADWESSGNHVAVYEPSQQGFRNLAVYAEIVEYVPAWDTRRSVEWRAYCNNGGARDTMLESRDVSAFNSPDEIVAWVAALV